ncbi:hypothetical protein CCZ01_09155 [Helicobacter monodelphidis]|uniref:hypothetical protein n=1 Tax=Helicobacter sp. 15-1451 TaxID=2004995 RepID=UPI000DCBC43B|nr:hypothetical protein [Helicobacter sp. 15-1451]RAX56564.1 hypothetical protein CCZ01_09155 [Helicobacter sp. 15-1451]
MQEKIASDKALKEFRAQKQEEIFLEMQKLFKKCNLQISLELIEGRIHIDEKAREMIEYHLGEIVFESNRHLIAFLNQAGFEAEALQEEFLQMMCSYPSHQDLEKMFADLDKQMIQEQALKDIEEQQPILRKQK